MEHIWLKTLVSLLILMLVGYSLNLGSGLGKRDKLGIIISTVLGANIFILTMLLLWLAL